MENHDREQFAINLTDQCKTHYDWLCVVRFGLKQLLENQQLLMEIIVREAQRMRDRSGAEGRVVADDARVIMQELGLRFMVT